VGSFIKGVCSVSVEVYDDVHVSFSFALGGLYCRLLILPKSIATDGREVACIDFGLDCWFGLSRLFGLSRECCL
jgi:hypothetical protein